MSSHVRRAPARARQSTPESRLRRKAQTLSAGALETLAKLMKDEKTAAPIRLAAAREVLDRGHGRPKLGSAAAEPEGLTVIVKRYSEVTEEELARSDEGEP
jgi:hypothetical protein